MKRLLGCLCTLAVLGTTGWEQASFAADRFTPLAPLHAPKIIGHVTPFPGFVPQNLLDGKENTEFSSNGNGLGTFIDFDFGRPTRIAAYRHLDRNDPANVGAVELIFADKPDFSSPIAKVVIPHAGTRAGKTFVAFPEAKTARYVRWQVTGLGPEKYGTVGGAEIAFFTSEDAEATPSRDRIELTALSAVEMKDGKPTRTVRVKLEHPYAEPADVELHVSGLSPRPIRLVSGTQTVDLALSSTDHDAPLTATVQLAGKTIVERQLTLKPVRQWTIFLLPHSHVDIGYTDVQTNIEKLHWRYIDEALEICRRTANYPAGSQFKWNSEVLWPVDGYLKQASPQKRDQFIAMVKAGQIELDGLYSNELTGLCRPEELFRLVGCAHRLEKQYGLKIDTAMISDVPGYTWGIVPAMAQSGIRYFSIGTNHVHRIGLTLEQWGDKPFYWVSPSGQEKVLCWVAGKGYSWFHLNGRAKKVPPEKYLGYLSELEAAGFPYDLLPLRYSIDGDNGPPDPELPDLVRQWNARFQWPKMVIGTGHEVMSELERRWGTKIPEVRGDFTPYWEDGAGSSAQETAAARTGSERLTQAETLFAMLRPTAYPVEKFYQAWKNIVLYNEHTWGAHCSITQPDSDFTKAQWKIKQAFAVDGAQQASRLYDESLADHRGKNGEVLAVNVYNTNSWARTDLVLVETGHKDQQLGGVRDSEGNAVASQRLADGRLAILAENVPPFGAKRFLLETQKASAEKSTSSGSIKANAATLENRQVRLQVDENTGAVASLVWKVSGAELVNRREGFGLNEFLYADGRVPKQPQRRGRPKIAVCEAGPLVARLRLESDAPGCRSVVTELTVIEGLGRVDVSNVVLRKQVRTADSVHIGFPANVPGGVMRMDIPWAVIRPEQDQLPGACKNYFSVGRWIDVSNPQYGLTCATLDAPLAEVGAITVDVASPFDPKAWINKLAPSQTFYSYAMNNYWETNYKADQDAGTFRYSLLPHGPFDPVAAARFGVERSQPLVVVPVEPKAPLVRPLLKVEPECVLVTSLKPADDGKGLVLRLHNAGAHAAQAKITWAEPKRTVRSSPKEEIGAATAGLIELVPSGIVTLRTVE